jgi:hypothetical protein
MKYISRHYIITMISDNVKTKQKVTVLNVSVIIHIYNVVKHITKIQSKYNVESYHSKMHVIHQQALHNHNDK